MNQMSGSPEIYITVVIITKKTYPKISGFFILNFTLVSDQFTYILYFTGITFSCYSFYSLAYVKT